MPSFHLRALVLLLLLSAAAVHVRAADGKAMEFYKSGVKKQEQRDYKGAVEDFDKAIAFDPGNARAYSARGLVKFPGLADYNGAFADLDHSVEIAPDSVEIRFARGNFIAHNFGNYNAALSDFDRVLALEPENVRALRGRACIKSRSSSDPLPAYPTWGHKQDLDGALADLDKAVALDPKRALVERADVKREKGDLDGAITDFTKAIRLNPGDSDIYLRCAEIRSSRGDMDGAINDYTMAGKCAKNSKHGGAGGFYFDIAELKERKGDYEGALQDYTLAISGSNIPKWWQSMVHERRGALRFTTGDLRGALGDFQDVAALPLRDVGRDFGPAEADDARIKLWIIRTKLGDKARADMELAAYLDKRTGPPSAYNNNGRDIMVSLFANDAKLLLGRMSDEDYQKANQNNSQDWYFLGMKHLLAGDKKSALDYFRKSLAPYSDAQPAKEPDEHELELKIPGIKALMK